MPGRYCKASIDAENNPNQAQSLLRPKNKFYKNLPFPHIMRILILRTLIIIICLIVIGSTLKAQSGTQISYFNPTPFPRSPTSTALERYGSYQVNEFTGIPNISIPLYTIEAGGFTIPISLSYHAAGIKVTDVASWAGAGWSVSAGGSVNRRVMGKADDGVYGYLAGYMLKTPSPDAATIAGTDSLENASKGMYDTKPDIYSYDFPGHGGKFFFDGEPDSGYKPRLMPYAPLVITHNYITPSGGPPYGGITNFNIADEHGNKYTFGDADVEVTNSSSAGTSQVPVNSTWMLENMISQNRRDTVSFSYHTDSISYALADLEVYSVTDQVNAISQIGGAGVYTASMTGPITPGNGSVVYEKLPAQINYKNGKVVFDLDTALRQDINLGDAGPYGYHAYGLKDIKVYNYNYGTRLMELQKTVVFYKSYFNPDTAKRLRLDSIQILDKTGVVIQHYSFDYNPVNLPYYNSYSQDYWGYYNGAPNSMLTPQQTIDFQELFSGPVTHPVIGSTFPNGRNSDSTHMQASVLTGIHYPTGGHTVFTYQANQYVYLDTLRLAGGLRIKTISSYDGINPVPMVKTYIYNTARANFFLNYSYFSTQQKHRYYGSPTGVDVAEARVRTYVSTPNIDLEPFDAATVVYPSVTEYIGTPGNNIGRTDYTFTDAPDFIDDASITGTGIITSNFFNRGHLWTKKEYMYKPGGTYQIVKAETNNYQAFRPQKDYQTAGLAIAKLNYNEGLATNPINPGSLSPDDEDSYVAVTYDVLTGDDYLISSITNVYDTNDTTKYTTSATTYNYDKLINQQVSRAYHTDSKGNTTVAVSKYPADYPAGNPIIDSMMNRNMQAEVIEKYDTLKNVATSVNAITSAQLNQYKTGSTANTIVPSTISTLSVAQPLTNFTPATVTSGSLTSDSRYVQMISFDNYDANNNIGQYTTRNATPVSILWDYQHYQPIAQAKNATSTNIAYTSFEADGTGNWTVPSTARDTTTPPLTGKQSYNLANGAISKTSLTAATTYVVTYWTRNASPLTIAGTVTGYPITGVTLNGWTFYQHQVTGQTTITVSGTGNMDELRLYPLGAQMTTYTYSPFMGVTSTSDPKGDISYYEYDSFQRLMNIKDENGNIVKNYSYHYPNQ